MTEYTLEVYGYLWQGSRAVYSYRIEEPQAFALTGPNGNPNRLAGDFQDVIDWRLVRCVSTYERTGIASRSYITRRVDKYKTLRGFRAGMTPRRFYQMANR